jgi:hypothetical protein
MDDLWELLQNEWVFLVVGYLISIAIETPVLLAGLSSQHTWRRRLAAGIWLTACTYPIVVLVIPRIFDPKEERIAYLSVAETFAPAAECLLFWAAFGPLKQPWRDLTVIVLANLASFGFGELLLYLLTAVPVDAAG